MLKIVRYAYIWCLGIAILLIVGSASAYPRFSPNWTPVEKKFLAASGRKSVYPNEYLPVLEARNTYELGKLTALRFIEWVQTHPKGVVAFTTGGTPEYFIKFLDHYKKNWRRPDVQEELHSYGINAKSFPDTTQLRMVQLEELYPLSPKHYKKLSNYIQRYYVNILGLKKENVLLMYPTLQGILAEKGLSVVFMNGKVDLSIMDHEPETQLETWQQQAIRELGKFCEDYEKKIRSWGGIDFIVIGVSYGGYLGFNGPGGKLDSKTHFIKLSHSLAAHAAKDLGGIEHARGKLAMTIGLGTMAIKPDAVKIILVSGESKADDVKNGVQNTEMSRYPITALQRYPNSRVYVNDEIGEALTDRHTEDIQLAIKHRWTQKLVADVVVEVAKAQNKTILNLTQEDFLKHERGKLLLQNPPKPLSAMLTDVRNMLIRNIENGLRLSGGKSKRILHTGPHHDDIVLGYYPLMDNLLYTHKNHFVYFTSGFNSVPDHHVLTTINRASDWWINKERKAIFDKPYESVINQFRNYYVKQDIEQMNMLETTIALKKLVEIYKINDVDSLKATIRWLKDSYFPNKQPGESDSPEMRQLKGMLREAEADRIWALKNVPLKRVTHLRSQFYSGSEFMKTPRYEQDVVPFINIFNSYKPDIITVDDDPDSAPPLTNFRVLQLIAHGLRSAEAHVNDDLQIWGYRNIWFKYKVTEANAYVPVSETMLMGQKLAFRSCYNTQRMASFPSPFYDGDFATLTTLIQREQLASLEALLGKEFFLNHPNQDVRNAAGFVFINQMSLNKLFSRVDDLQPLAEIEESFVKTYKDL